MQKFAIFHYAEYLGEQRAVSAEVAVALAGVKFQSDVKAFQEKETLLFKQNPDRKHGLGPKPPNRAELIEESGVGGGMRPWAQDLASKQVNDRAVQRVSEIEALKAQKEAQEKAAADAEKFEADKQAAIAKAVAEAKQEVKDNATKDRGSSSVHDAREGRDSGSQGGTDNRNLRG